MSRKHVLWSVFAVALLAFATVQFIPGPPLLVPAELAADARADHRLLNFEGIHNFRDLGGYPTDDGRQVRWGALYRGATLAHASAADLEGLQRLQLRTLVDFRSQQEKDEEPNRLPEPLAFEVVDIPTLDDGNKAMVAEIFERVETGNFDGFDPDGTMVTANRQFATEFTPQFSRFIAEVQRAGGEPVAWHCSAGKDRTGWAAAVLLRILGVPQDVVIADYMESKEHALAARSGQLRMLRLFKGDEAADKLAVLMGVEEHWLQAGFDAVDEQWGSFDAYVRDGLGLTTDDIETLRNQLLI